MVDFLKESLYDLLSTLSSDNVDHPLGLFGEAESVNEVVENQNRHTIRQRQLHSIECWFWRVGCSHPAPIQKIQIFLFLMMDQEGHFHLLFIEKLCKSNHF